MKKKGNLIDAALIAGYVMTITCREFKHDHLSYTPARYDVWAEENKVLRDIITVKKAEEDVDAEWQKFLPVLDEAIDAFLSARETEGANMKADIVEKRRRVEALAKKIAPLSEAIATIFTPNVI